MWEVPPPKSPSLLYNENYMNNTYSLFRSKTFWTLVIMSVLPIANAIVPVLPASVQDVVTVLLGLVAAQFHKSTATSSGAVN